ncbi:MAG TPA: YbhB/YbcL family Raf kinase inhibitor-like protein [Candidatus Manganitrophaceae bacterium]|nr:YbhB/YbcL family Raf kinase inhibitor-like protein [Candidatus Manganitrophaceae bacterium]
MSFEFKSPAFGLNQIIPKKYTCDGEDLSPPLSWSGPPSGCQEFALIMDDPDAPRKVWVHWVLYHLPPDLRALEEGIGRKEIIEGIGAQGVNDFGGIGYGGPCPPPGAPHRYVFKLYALNEKIKLRPGATKQRLLDTIKEKILGEAEWVGKYGR